MRHSLFCMLDLLLLSTVFYGNATASKPRALITAHEGVIPAGGSVTLSCSVEGSAGWKFDWFRRDSAFSVAQKIGAGTSEHTISISEGGIYYCRGGRGDPVFSTEDSVPVKIKKRVLYVVKSQHRWAQMFIGETIILQCEIQGGEGKEMTYEWKSPNPNIPETSSEYRISRVSVSHSGDYRCRGSSDYLLAKWSDPFTLIVLSNKPRATLTAQSSTIPAGGSVTLSCSVEGSAGWKFDWFRRDSVFSKAQLMRGNEANRVISVSQGGLYHCRGGRGDPVYYTEDSSEFIVEETSQTEKPRASLGGSVTLNCSVNDSAGWRYYWFRRTSESSTAQRITNGTSSHTFSVAEGGIYHCRGGRGDPVFFTDDSVSVTIETNGFRCESHSFLVPFIIGLVFGSLLTVPVLLCCICCHTRIRDRCRNRFIQSPNINQSSAAPQTPNQSDTQIYSSLLHGDLSVYESIRNSGITRSDFHSRHPHPPNLHLTNTSVRAPSKPQSSSSPPPEFRLQGKLS
ncbi:basement membrane-specific heparan sulfate proteoglycan core protein [Pundamilia nyererei]|uniref:Basement membrane-specific heparan sulfate proteoglycan core protein n=1 Tax=Pundamilia nyererei TaxID=303518 RepID=A0A9Y3VZ04_9CICH|nr:PREDICTED: killer cell immunoglobulin-like receptor 3DL2 [Pundamilia nyererei]